MFRLTTLGATDLRDRLGRPVRDVLAQPKRFALLAFLAVEGRRGPVPRDRILALFWPESDTERARNSLSQALHHLRQGLGPGVIESQGVHTIGVAVARLWCDATVFLEALERGEAELALDLYRGDFCPTLFVSGAPAVEEWLDEQRRHLRGQALAVARTLAERLLAGGDTDGAARAARRALALRPDDESDVRALLGLLERAGDSAGALLAYQEYAKRLTTELETAPAPETRQLVDAIRRRREAPAGAPAAVAPAGPAASAPTAAAVVPRRRRARATIAGVAIAIAVLAVLGIRSLLPRASASTVRAIAVFPFMVRSSPSLGYLREGMVDLLSAKLSGAAGIRAIDPRAVIAATGSGSAAADPAGSERIARRLEARWFVTGDVVEVAGRIQVNGALFTVGGGPQAVTTASVTGDTTALFQLVDDLTGRLLAGLLTGRDTSLTRLAAVTTHSLPALKAYLAGEQALRAGRDAQAGAAFRDAALLDTTFALAQYRLAVTANWVGIADVNPVVWARIAAHHARRLTPQVRDFLAAFRAYKDVQADDAERRYRALTAAYPDHVEGWLMLGETYFHYSWFRGRSSMEAWAPFQRVLTLDPGNAHAPIHLARLAALEGRETDLDTLVATYLARFGDAAERSLEMRALRAFVHDDPDQRRQVAQAVRDADGLVAYSVLEAAAIYAQNLDAAAELAPRFADRGESGVAGGVLGQGRRLLAALDLTSGRWDRTDASGGREPADSRDWRLESEALLAAEPLVALPRARIAALRDSLLARRPYPLLQSLAVNGATPVTGDEMQSYLAGLLSVRLGELATAEAIATRLAGAPGGDRDRPGRMLAKTLRAELARSRGDTRRALAELDGFEIAPAGGRLLLPLHWGVRERFLRAELLVALGRDDEAADLYDSIESAYDLPYLALAHFRRAQIHARQHEVAQARFHYGRFLSLWKDCDPAFRPLVEQGRRELAALPASPQ